MLNEALPSAENSYAMSGNAIRKFLPHRYPFLMIDRVVSIEPTGKLGHPESSEDKIGTRVIAQKNVSCNESIFQGHFPEFSIFPGVLTIEAMAQAATMVTYPYVAHDPALLENGFSVILLGVDEVRFRRPILPGDVIRIEAVLEKCRGSVWGFRCEASVDGARVAEAKLLANMTLTPKKEVSA